MSQIIGFIGLGQMGIGMAGNLLAAGFSLRVYNRTPQKTKPLIDKGAVACKTPADAATPGGIIISMLSDDAALEAVVTDDLLSALGPGGLHLSMSTVSPETSKRLAERHTRAGSSLLSAPVFGRPEAAAAGKLYICVSGPAPQKQRAQAIFNAMGQGVFDFGETIGAANVVKLAGNFLLTAAIEAMAEACALAEKNGIPRDALLNMFTSTLFNCPIYVNYAKRIIAADFDKVGFSIPLILKDMHLVQQTATASQTPMPTLNLLCDRYVKMLANGEKDLDASAIALGAARDAGLKW